MSERKLYIREIRLKHSPRSATEVLANPPTLAASVDTDPGLRASEKPQTERKTKQPAILRRM
jgi:hypothetical protein